MRDLWRVLLCGIFFVCMVTMISCASDDDDDIEGGKEWGDVVAPHRETHERFTVVWLAGTPYEMGRQHGKLLRDELAAAIEWIDSIPLANVKLLTLFAETLGLTDLAWENSYTDIVEECHGLVDATLDLGWTMEFCLLLNFGDVLVEFLTDGFPPAEPAAPGCTQMSAAGEATVDGRLYHGRVLDWSEISYLLDYPVIFVRQPGDGISHAYIGFPGNLSPYSGINAAGISVASDEADPLDNSMHDRVGRSHVQLQAQLLKHADSLASAREMVLGTDHMTVELIMVTDGNAKQAEGYEMSAKAVGVRTMEDGILYITNHFVAPETQGCDAEPAGESSLKRFDRAAQLTLPGGEESLYGALSPEAMVGVLRDRVDPWSGEEYPEDTFDNDSGIGVNGAIYQIVFDPENLHFWVAAGAVPVPRQTFVGFSLGELLGLPDAIPVAPAVFE